MKYISFFIIGLLLIFFCRTGSCNSLTVTRTDASTNVPANDTLKIMSSPELYNLTTNWAAEYTRLNPTINIVITRFTDNQLLNPFNLGFISNEYPEVENDEAKWKMVVGHNAIVPVINAGNPMLNEISLRGISSKGFARLINAPEKMSWADIINGGQNSPVHFFVLDNEAVKTGIAKFTDTNPLAISGIKLSEPEELISALQKDLYAIGFCRLIDVRKANSNEMIENIKLLPIDKNGNGRIDNFENIYASLETVSRGIWIGKYPNTLCGSIYVVSPVKPADENSLSFLTWILADGGQFLNTNGYSELAGVEKESNLTALLNNELTVSESNKPQTSYIWLIIIVGLIIAGVILTAVIYNFGSENSPAVISEINLTPALNENIIAAPKGLYFDKTHTWAFMEKDGIVRVGVDDFIQHITGTLTRIKMREPGEKVRKGEKILSIINDGKQLNICTPVSGIIKEKNNALITDSSIMNSSPYSEGWVYMIEPNNWLRETEFLFMSEKYKEWLKDEFKRLKDFFAASVKTDSSVYAHIILQDGGQLTDNVLADLGPEVWEDFQTNFIDTSK